MFRLIFTVFSLCMLVIQAPAMIKQLADSGVLDGTASVPGQRAVSSPRKIKTSSRPSNLTGRQVAIAADPRGQYVTNAKFNGRRAKVLVDTGATSVAINQRFARQIGLKLKKSDFKHTANTANGAVLFAAAKVDEIKIDRIRVQNVQVAVLPDKSLDGILLGMSFLSRLKSFQVKDNKLVLSQ
jgi:aspartyl protease family protein